MRQPEATPKGVADFNHDECMHALSGPCLHDIHAIASDCNMTAQSANVLYSQVSHSLSLPVAVKSGLPLVVDLTSVHTFG